MTNNISQKLIGCRVKAAREAKHWTQTKLTEALGLNDRQTISDIENGKRAIKSDELIILTEALEKDIDFFLNPFSTIGEAEFSWRASLPDDALNGFEIKAAQWIGLLRWLRKTEKSSCPNPLKYSLRLTNQSTYEDASSSAERLIDILNLGIIPAERLIEKIETELDFPILFVDTTPSTKKGSISGATCHLQELNIILVNRNESEARRYYDLAHELFHALTWDAMKPPHREFNQSKGHALGKRMKQRIEQLADNFAATLLMPRKSLDSLIDHRKINDIEHLLGVAMRLHVSPEALAWRIYNLKWIDDEILNSLKKMHQQNPSVKPKRFSPSFINMLYNSINRGRLSARKAAKTIDMNLTQFSELFAEHSLQVPFEL